MGPRLIKALTRLQSPIFTLMRGRLQGPPTLRLWTMGRTSGQERAVLLLYLDDGPRVIVVASYGGYSEHPQWWKNLLAEPNCRIWSAARGAEEVVASELEGEEREAVWERLISMYSPYAGYQEKTSRRIPLVALTPSESG
ncbi:MAG: nitroreductase/quinone reductase family protein [Chloroflexi bacterium]|nr:nitroreductase/quinone reductase family protein [Chloroflexota bacterium]MCY3697174.1 nitroreductase/quinone reductase family protein [Chloroflexota bacterium]